MERNLYLSVLYMSNSLRSTVRLFIKFSVSVSSLGSRQFTRSFTTTYSRFASLSSNKQYTRDLVRYPNHKINMADISKLTQRLQNFGIEEPLQVYSGSNPVENPFDIFRSYITKELASISGVSEDLIYPALEWTNTSDRGDLVLPIPRLRVKGTKPDVLATEWVGKFNKGKYILDAVAKGAFIQFYFNPSLLSQIVIKDVLTKKENFGKASVGNGQKVIVEFSSPNIAKPFHAGHLRSTIIGGFISNLHEICGFEVVRMNYLGDWGKQFGVLGVGFKRYGSTEKLETDPINHLFEVYVAINKDIEKEKEESSDKTSQIDEDARVFFKKMTEGDEYALGLWEKFRDLSIEKYKDTYARLNIKYDSYAGESQVSEENMQYITKLMEEKDIIVEDQGAKLVDLTKHNKKLGKAIVQKRDGTSLYLTRDIAGAYQRYNNYKFDKMIYVIASQQDLHTAQFFKILELLDFPWAKKLTHVNFGMVLGMSTRKGTVVFLDTILEETKEKMHEVMKKNEAKYAQIENPEEIADLVGISAIMIQDMAAKRVNNYNFNMGRMFSFEGDTGPYLQYAHSRLRSVERNASTITADDLENADLSLLTEPCAIELLRVIAQYPDVILNAYRTMEPSTIVTYLFKLTHIVSSCYDILWVAGQEKELAIARLALYSSARQVLNNGMRLLGLTPVNRM